jgi:hypothetical protein
MNWTKSGGIFTAHAQGLDFILEPAEWSIWDLSQAKASALHLANLKASGTPWAPGLTVRLFYRMGKPPPPLKARATKAKPNGPI